MTLLKSTDVESEPVPPGRYDSPCDGVPFRLFSALA